MSTYITLPPLRNRYFIMRHGESEANVAGLITSDPAECISRYGLTERGKTQATSSVKQAIQKLRIPSGTIIYCSDFKRARETAEVAQRVLGAEAVRPAKELRERSFGAYNGKHVRAYIEIWAKDQHDEETLRENGVESPGHILERLLKLIRTLETQYQGECLLLVSHGDPLQVIQAAFAGLEPHQSRALPYIEPAEVRPLKLTVPFEAD